MLSSYNTVLNLNAIINILVFVYADKTAFHVISQELGLLRQGDLPLFQYFDNIQRKLTLLTKKTIITQDAVSAAVFNKKFREVAFQTFATGLQRSLRNFVFPAQPRDLPLALALS